MLKTLSLSALGSREGLHQSYTNQSTSGFFILYQLAKVNGPYLPSVYYRTHYGSFSAPGDNGMSTYYTFGWDVVRER